MRQILLALDMGLAIALTTYMDVRTKYHVIQKESMMEICPNDNCIRP